jgi:diguanylate cyclase (GGDEF)-like protein
LLELTTPRSDRHFMRSRDGRHIMNMFLGQPLLFASRRTGTPIRELLDQADDDRPVEVVLDEAGWSSYGQARRVLETAAAVLGEPAALGEIADAYDGEIGTMAEISDSIHRRGSLHAMFEAMTGGQNIAVTYMTTDGHRTGESEWLFESGYEDGFEPYPEHCVVFGEMFRISARFFGQFDPRVVEETCVLRGSDRCRHRVSWAEVDDAEQERILLKARVIGLEQRLELFQDTVTGLVLAGDLNTALDEVVRSAARAFGAPGFVLAVDALPGRAAHVHTYGVEANEGDRIASAILAGEDTPEIITTVSVASSRRRYGQLAAYSPHGARIGDPAMLKAYARLAATALDSAVALEEAHREAARAKALLELATGLADLEAIDDMARRIVEAAPTVVGADRAAFLIADNHAGTARLVAASGYPSSVMAHAIGVEVPIHTTLEDIVYFEGAIVHDDALAPMREGSIAHVVVRLVHDDVTEGWLSISVTDDPSRLAPSAEIETQLRGLAAQACTAIRNARLVDQIRYQAMHDALTGLPNRALIADRAEQLLARSRRDHTPISVLFFDLDGFKTINDSLGHGVGDQLLKAAAARLSATVRASDTLARLGGDEFVVLVDGAGIGTGPDVAAERILEVLRQPFLLDDVIEPITISASIGIATSTGEIDADELLRNADVALYEAKATGKDQAVVFAPEMQAALSSRVNLEGDLRRAIERGEFFLVYQPILDLRSGMLTGVEALIRWDHPTRGVVAPNAFVPLLEQTGLIVAAGRWVLEEACNQLAAWHRAGQHIDMSVNVSARQLQTDDFINDVSSVLSLTGVAPASLTLEITETTIMDDTAATIARLRALKGLGVRLAIDDFGTGYSSLAYLRQFPVDALKIDRSFISAIADSAEAVALIHTLVSLGKALGLSTLAEGIEDHDQFARLQVEDCDSGQGFLFSRPLEAEAIEAFVQATARHPSAHQPEDLRSTGPTS